MLAHGVEDAEELGAPVGAAHPAQHVVGAGLQRHVQARHDVRRLGHGQDDVVGERRRVRAGEPDPLEALDLTARAQQLAEGEAVAELDAVGVDVLAEERHLDDALGHERLDLGEDLAGPAVLLLAAQARHDAEGARVVAPDRDGDPAAVGRVAPGRQGRGEHLEALEDLDLGLAVVRRAVEQRGQGPDVVGAEHDVDPGRTLDDGASVLLGHAPAHGDLQVRVLLLGRAQLAEVAVELVVGVLAHGARVEDDDVGDLGSVPRGQAREVDVPGGLEEPREALAVVDVHLAPVGAHVIGLRHRPSPSRRPGGARTARGPRLGYGVRSGARPLEPGPEPGPASADRTSTDVHPTVE